MTDTIARKRRAYATLLKGSKTYPGVFALAMEVRWQIIFLELERVYRNAKPNS